MIICYSSYRKLLHKALDSDQLGFHPGFADLCWALGQVTEPLACDVFLWQPEKNNRKGGFS